MGMFKRYDLNVREQNLPSQFIIVVAKCRELINEGGRFDFKGVYRGHLVRELMINQNGLKSPWHENGEYVIHVQVTLFNEGVLVGRAQKSRPLI